jgi:hypothetical protein
MDRSRGFGNISGIFSHIVGGKWTGIVRNIGPFLWVVWKSGKLAELTSFIIWEALHALRLFHYVEFTGAAPVMPDHDWAGVAVTLAVKLSCEVGRIDCLRTIHVDRYGNRYACANAALTELHCSLADGSSTVSTFESDIMSVFVSSSGTIFVSLDGGLVVRSSDQAKSFSPSLQLSHENSWIWSDHGITETARNELIVGEYGTVVDRKSGFRSVAFLYCSIDDGASWEVCDFLKRDGVNKHVHMVRYCRTIDAVILTDGDNKKQLWVGRPVNGMTGLKHMKWRLINRFHIQTGGYTALVEHGDRMLFGTDYMGGTNFIIASNDGVALAKSAVPDPYRKCPILGMVLRAGRQGTEIWTVLHDSCFERTKSLVMLSRDGGRSWIKAIEYDGSRFRVEIASSSSTLLNEVYISAYDHAGGMVTFIIRDPDPSKSKQGFDMQPA